MPVVSRAWSCSVQRARQAAGAAAQVDGAHAGRGTDQRQEIEERLLALALELVVLRRDSRCRSRRGSTIRSLILRRMAI